MSAPVMAPKALVAGATQVIAGGPAYYGGIVVRETSAAACVLRIWDNASAASGTLVDVVSLAANGVYRSTIPGGAWCANGVFVERVSGTNYEGSVLLG